MTPHACVVGDVSLVRALGRARIPVALATADAGAPAARSRHCRAVVEVPSFVDRPEEAVRALVAFAAAQPDAPVLFPEGDHDLLAISRGRAELSACFRLSLPAAELVEDLVDKLRFAALSERLGLPAPATRPLWRRRPLVEETAGWERFPCILKPSMRTRWFDSPLRGRALHGNQKAIRLESRADLERLLPALERHETGLVLQEAVPGGEERILSYHAYLRPDGTLGAEFTGRKVRTAPRVHGLSSCLEITDDPRVARAGRAVLERLGFTGVVKLDFKADARDGRLFLLEANPRFTLWHHPAALAGVNVPELVYRDLVEPGRPRGPAPRARAGVRWMFLRNDLRALPEYRAAGELDVLGWLGEVWRADVTEDWVWSDPVPGLVDAAAAAGRAVRSVLRSARRRAPAEVA
jgi:predicted ATP-grasp superfamily ATP-dependent carboligase